MGVVLVASVLVVSSCGKQSNALFCDEATPCSNAGDFCDLVGLGGGIRNVCVARPMCDEGCISQLPICSEDENLCRMCIAGAEGNAECAAIAVTTPVCTEEGRCTGCTSSGQCEDNAAPECVEDGSCQACQDGATGDAVCAERNAAFPYCIGGGCVECLQEVALLDADCSDENKPICEGNACRGCQAHAECPSEACDLETGACILEQNIVHVAKGEVDDESCGTIGDPCGSIQYAIDERVEPPRTTIMVRAVATVYDEAISVSGEAVFILGKEDGPLKVRIQPFTAVGPGLRADSGSTVKLDTLTIQDAKHSAAGDNGHGIICSSASSVHLHNVAVSGSAGAGIFAGVDSNCTIALKTSLLDLNKTKGLDITGGTVTIESSSLIENDGGGLSIEDSHFVVENTFVVRNGKIGADVGGVFIDNGVAIATQIFRFNTIVQNEAKGSVASGVFCKTLDTMTADSNIVYFNKGILIVDGNDKCEWAYSNIQGDSVFPGVDNIKADPLFENKENGEFRRQDFRLMNAEPNVSPCINKADPQATLGRDFEGGIRPNDGRSDIGADEVGVP